MPTYSSDRGTLALFRTTSVQCWPLIIYLLIGAVLGVGSIRQVGLADSETPTHSNFLRAALRGGRRQFWCANDPNVCLDREKNPWGGTTCCHELFCKDIANDPNHCGGCGMTCAHGLACCGGECVDIRSDPRHCGSCHEECPRQLGCSYALCGYGR